MKMSFDQFQQSVVDSFPNGNTRYGQYWFNLLNAIRPSIADKIRGTVDDPYYLDRVPTRTEQIVATLWADERAHDEV